MVIAFTFKRLAQHACADRKGLWRELRNAVTSHAFISPVVGERESVQVCSANSAAKQRTTGDATASRGELNLHEER